MTLARFTAKKLTPAEIEALVATAVRELSGMPGLQAMILFGSAALGTMSEASDLDIVMIFDTSARATEAGRSVHGLRKDAKWPMDILCTDVATYLEKREVGGVYFVAHREGRLIFGKPL